MRRQELDEELAGLKKIDDAETYPDFAPNELPGISDMLRQLYPTPPLPDEPFDLESREDRIECMAARESQGRHLYHPRDKINQPQLERAGRIGRPNLRNGHTPHGGNLVRIEPVPDQSEDETIRDEIMADLAARRTERNHGHVRLLALPKGPTTQD